ncbi:glycosyltransferase family 2 protein [Billgrantia bachuensis]|uniref:Glycosyltransferase family 2 protein n=1 Tax=Billgrantia bachuensis TaxID=2717286 RepID=A0ABX0PMA3_9GAMM|nr:glycosyltransferase family 2 protein [Halomonas bachuensis]NIC04402.1 glycosyltransferase family 2 protein [Halomonas bachuensis]
MSTLISIVVPVYNKENYVSRAIKSALAQTYTDFELIIVDDASTDRSMQKVAEFKDSRIRVLHRPQPGPGGYAARNYGIREARGSWIALLDADDAWFPEHLTQSMRIASEFPDISIVSAARMSDVGGTKKLDPFAKRFIDHGPQILYLSDYLEFACKGLRAMGTNSILVKRDALYRSSIFPEGRTERSGDLYTWVELLARMKRMVWSPHVASISYRQASFVSRNSVPSMRLFHEMVSDLEPYIDEKQSRILKRYANKMVKYAWLEMNKINSPIKPSELRRCFFWEVDLFFCSKWFLISLLPFEFLESLHRRYSLSR